jgi:hypothetical protein
MHVLSTHNLGLLLEIGSQAVLSVFYEVDDFEQRVDGC